MNPQEEWIEDAQRFQPDFEERRHFLAQRLSILDRLQRPYVLLQGSWEEREKQAIAAIENAFEIEGCVEKRFR